MEEIDTQLNILHNFYLNEDDYLHARDHMKGLLEVIYGDKSIAYLEEHLEEICAVLNMNLPPMAVQLRKYYVK